LYTGKQAPSGCPVYFSSAGIAALLLDDEKVTLCLWTECQKFY